MSNIWVARKEAMAKTEPSSKIVNDSTAWPSAIDALSLEEKNRKEKNSNSSNNNNDNSNNLSNNSNERKGKKNWVTVPVEEVLPVKSQSRKSSSNNRNKNSKRSNNTSKNNKNKFVGNKDNQSQSQQSSRSTKSYSNSKPSNNSSSRYNQPPRKSNQRRNYNKTFHPNNSIAAQATVAQTQSMSPSFHMFGAPPPPPNGYPQFSPMPMPTPITTTNYPLDPLRFYLLGQLEYYFTTQNLVRDFFLRQQMDTDGWVDIPIFTTFNRIKALSTDLYLLREVFSLSQLVEVYYYDNSYVDNNNNSNNDNKGDNKFDMSRVSNEISNIENDNKVIDNPVGKVRLAHGVWKKWVLPNAPKSSIILDDAVDSTNIDEGVTPVQASEYNQEIASKAVNNNNDNNHQQESQQ